MTRDFFKEQLVKKIYTDKDRKKKIRIIAICVAISVFIANQLCFFGMKHEQLFVSYIMLSVLLIGIDAFIGYKLIKGLDVEFEYSYTNGELDIDIIRNRAKRKNVFSGVVEEFEIVCPSDDKEHLAMYDNLPVADLSSAKADADTYTFVASYKGKRRKFVFEPCDEIVKAMRQDLGSRMYIKR